MTKASLPFRVAYVAYDYQSSCPGSHERIEYIETVDDQGVTCVVPAGKSNIDDELRACYADTLIYGILDRVSRGDVGLLDKHQGAYIDITGLPTNLHEATAAVRKASEFFEDLPIAVKQQFNNNAQEFVAAYGTQKFYDVFSPIPSAPGRDVDKKEESKNE